MIPKDLQKVQTPQMSVSTQEQCCVTKFCAADGYDTKRKFQCSVTQMYLTSRIRKAMQFQLGEGAIPYKLQYQADNYQRNKYVAYHANEISTENRANNPDIR
jgi:carboxylesterase type B